MKKLFTTIAISSTLLFSATASADWNGLYVGAHVGHAENDVSGVFDSFGSSPVPDLGKLEDDETVYGGQIGYNFQHNNMVYGIELNYTDADMEESLIDGESNIQEFENEDFWSIRGRVGWLLNDHWLVYGTAGAASMDAELRVEQDENNSTPDKLSFDDTALVLGFGVERMFDNNLSLRAEALWMDFDESKNLNVPAVLDDADTGDNIDIGEVWSINLGISYNF